MLINLRNALMSGAGLPYDAEVEYLESTGTQWIATGISAAQTSSSIKIVATLKFTDVSTGEHDLAGSGNAATPTMGRNGSNYFMWAKGGTSWYPAACDTNWHTVSYTFNQPSGRVFELDGVSYTGSQSNSFATGDGIHIFASGPNRFPLNCQLSKLEIWQNGTLVRDFIPVRKGTVGYLYDRVSGKLFGNAGTGDFVLGPDVVPVEYIESHGTEYIDTGVIAGDDTTFSVRFNCTSTNDTAIYGGRSQSQGRQWILPLQMNQIQFGYGSIYKNINVQYRGNWLNIDTSLSAESYTYKVTTDGGVETLASTPRQSFTNTAHILLFAAWNNTAVQYKTVAKVAKFQIWKNGTSARKMLPIRVGTDATSWEGAMMDVLTRRIYRNAGNGAFTYGNDLKYPIPAA